MVVFHDKCTIVQKQNCAKTLLMLSYDHTFVRECRIKLDYVYVVEVERRYIKSLITIKAREGLVWIM